MRLVSSENLEQIGKGVTATVYALDNKTILKVFRNVVPQEEIDYEFTCANLVNSLGIPTPAALEIVQSGSEKGIIYNRVCGVTLSDEIKANPGDYFEYGKKYGSLVHQIHSKSVPQAKIPEAVPFMENIFRRTNEFINEDERKWLISYLHMVPQSYNLLHGDISPVNIMVEDGCLIVIDVPTIMKGHPVFDLLQPYAYCKMTPDLYTRYLSLSEEEKATDVGKFMARFGSRYLGKDAAELVWDGFFRGYFGENPKISKDDLAHVLCFYNSIKLMGSVYMRKKFGDDVVLYLVNEGRTRIEQLSSVIDNCLTQVLTLENYL